jgi:ion channel-forming bestrophin family protein
MDPNTYSPLPYFMRLRGSVLPKMILPLLFVAGWSTMVTCITKFVWSLAVNSYCSLTITLTKASFLWQSDSWLLWPLRFVLQQLTSGILMGSSMLLSRGTDGRYWQQLLMTTRMFARVLWVHVKERTGEDGKEDILAKLLHPRRSF